MPVSTTAITAVENAAVENPFQAFDEMFRVLKKDGYCFIYVPFIYYYHAQPGYYGDFWRYTEDGVRHLSRNFTSIEIQSIRWPLETWVYLSPFGRIKFLNTLARKIDVLLKKQNSKQTSGYNIFLTK